MNYNGAGTVTLLSRFKAIKRKRPYLSLNTEYVYSVGDGAMNVTNVKSPASFKTPASNLDTFNFNWVTDVHAAHSSSTMAKRSNKHLLISQMLHLF